ncbi:MAG: hypothetical protein QW638_08145 [Candidatus Bathyarchaeia archaeon]
MCRRKPCSRGHSRWAKGVQCFGSLLWSWSEINVTVTSVDVSDDGNVVAAAIHNSTSGTYYLLFWKDAKTLSGTPPPNWSSEDLMGRIKPDALAVSGDGDQVVVVGTGPNVYYWNNSLTLTGPGKATTWDDVLGGLLEYVDISDDGNIIAILGRNSTSWEPFAFVYKDSKTRTGSQSQGYNLTYTFGTGDGLDMALSDNGLYMVVGAYIAAGFWEGRVYFFNTSMSEPWAPQWIWRLALNEHAWAVDISDNGDTVAVVTNWWETQPNYKPCVLGIVHDASTKYGTFIGNFDKQFIGAQGYTDHRYHDVSMDGLGMLAVGGTGDYVFAVNATTGGLLWYYNGTWPLVSKFVRVSEDGSALVSAGSVIDSLYYFGTATAVVTFHQYGVGPDYAGPVLNVDGVDYTVADLPVSFTWTIGSKHTFLFYDPLNVGSYKRYVWAKTEGLSTGRTDEITVPSGGGLVNATYKTQYQITVTASPTEALGGDFEVKYIRCGTTYTEWKETPWTEWVDAGTTVTVSEPQPYVQNYQFKGYSPSNSVYMNASKTITLIYIQLPVGGVITPTEVLATPLVSLSALIAAAALLAIAAKRKST